MGGRGYRLVISELAIEVKTISACNVRWLNCRQRPSTLNILQQENGHKGGFYLEEDGIRLAEIVYSWFSEDGIIIEHTEVAAQLEGKGVGAALVQAVVQFARERNLKIMPLCPFAHTLFARKTDYRDVWYQH